MPELPEVETIVRGLENRVTGKIIKDIELRYQNLFRDCHGKVYAEEEREGLLKNFKGKKISKVGRRGKYILFRLEEITLVVHLRMTGKFSSEEEALGDKHSHLIIYFEDESFLVYNDIRKFGTFQLISCKEEMSKATVSKLGPEPLGEDFTLDYLKDELRKTKKNIKGFLLSQDKIAGIGNIYADEVLFFAGVSPKRIGSTLEEEEIVRIHQGIREKLELGIEAGGASIRNYVNEAGEKGNFQNLIQVYGKKGQNCPVCENQFTTETVAGRGSTYCSECQK